MIKILQNKAFAGILLLLVLIGLLFYYREEISLVLIQEVTDTKFRYYLSPFMPLISLLLVVVNFGLISTLFRNEKLELAKQVKAASSHLLSFLTIGLIGWGIHLAIVINAINNKNSFSLLEDNVLLYHISDISMVVGFLVGGLVFLKKNIHYAKF